MKRSTLANVLAAVMLVVPAGTRADIEHEEAVLESEIFTPRDEDYRGSRFGTAVGLGSSWLAASAPYYDGGGGIQQDLGIVLNYVPGEEGWQPDIQLPRFTCYEFNSSNSCGGSGPTLGHSLALGQDEDGGFHLAIGRTRASGQFGQVAAMIEVFSNDGSWDFPPAVAFEDSVLDFPYPQFGASVAASGEGLEPTALVGVPVESTIRIVPLDGGETTTMAPDGDVSSFGRTVAIHGDRAVVGSNSGVHLLTRSAGSPDFAIAATIAPPDGSGSFGASLALRGSTLLVGAPSTVGEEGADVGIGYLYDFEDPGDPLHVFEAPDPALRERLGWAVALGESFAALSAPGGDGSIEIGSLDGRVLIFDL
ncbi:MAG: hypothetical protein VCB78_05505, partial [Myxococcota bacterium]